ncbi:MAG TPA: HEAT repeat domain-containing protein [Kofleriaceae bacterium]
MTDCDRQIRDALSVLDAPRERVQDFLVSDEACVARLVALPEICIGPLLDFARALLRGGPDGTTGEDEMEDREYKLQVILRALFQRTQSRPADPIVSQVGALVIEALLGSTAADKETYVTYLLELGDARAPAALHDFVASTPATDADDGEGWALTKAIEALRYNRAQQATSSVVQHLDHSAERVRRAAIDFLVEVDASAIAPEFVRRLGLEDDPDNARAMVKALTRWHQIEALPALHRLGASDLARDNAALAAAVHAAINALGDDPNR